MVYERFLTTVKKEMETVLGPDYHLSLQKVPKNNGLVLDGLCIQKGDSSIASAIYLNTCYEYFRSGMPFEDIVDELLSLYYCNEAPPDLDFQELLSYEAVKSRIVFKLIHAKANHSLLQQIPHIEWLDLALVFYIHLHEEDNGIITALVHNEHLNTWKISLDELREKAFVNTPKLLPPTVTAMDTLLERPEDISDIAEHAAPFYILSNTSGINGAGCILYNDIIKNFADTAKQDVIILPSSIHEVLLLPDTGDISHEEMIRLVTQINETEVSEEERLSNEVYIYSRSQNSIHMASNPALTAPV